MKINGYIIYLSIFTSLATSVLLYICPFLDIKFSHLFFSNYDHNFLYSENKLVLFSYYCIPWLVKLLIISAILNILYVIYQNKKLTSVFRSKGFVLLFCASIGPGLIVNSILKENFGRARPINIVEFAGDKNFSQVFVSSDQCERNCSFSSGHAAMAFFFSGLAYFFSRKYFNIIYLLGVGFGLIVGLGRIMRGGHFLSDVMISCSIVLIVNHILFYYWLKYKKS